MSRRADSKTSRGRPQPHRGVNRFVERQGAPLGEGAVVNGRERGVGLDRSQTARLAQPLGPAAKQPRPSAVPGAGGYAREAVEAVGRAAAVAECRERLERVSEALMCEEVVASAAGGLAEDLEAARVPGLLARKVTEAAERAAATD
jgi:hypothetical protein